MVLDVLSWPRTGYNYSPYAFERDHTAHPARVIVATETYPLSSKDNFEALVDFRWLIGTFVWTAIDYIGASPHALSLPRSLAHPLRYTLS